MTEQQLKELKKKVSESLSITRQRILTRQPFTGGILMRLEIIPVRDCMCNTALTDGSRIDLARSKRAEFKNTFSLFIRDYYKRI